MVAAIILTCNQRELTLGCLESLCSAGDPPFYILLWDNGSTDGTAEAVSKRFPDVVVHHHSLNLGVAGGRNAAAQMALERFNPDYLLFLDNDTEVEPGFVANLRAPLIANQAVGQTQAKLRFMHDRRRLNDGGGARIDFFRWQVTPVGRGEMDRGQHDEVAPCAACGGAAMMVRSGLFLRLGGFEMAFNPYGPEDLDFSLRLQKAGYAALYVPQAVAYHQVSHTYGAQYDEQYARHKVRHWLLFMRRHASMRQKIAFFLLGAPLLAARVVAREVRRGNIAAVRGFMHGLLQYLKEGRPARQ
jgi:GT2 family glycosyltransferase